MVNAEVLGKAFPKTEVIEGQSVTFRLMTSEDARDVLEFARELPAADLVYTRWDITTEEGVGEWLKNIEAGRTSTVLAELDGEIVGYGSLHHHLLSWTRHMGELRILVNPKARGIGLGRYLGRELLRMARDLGLRRATVQIASDQPRVRHMFEELGFHAEALLHDWLIDRNDRTCDLIIMTHHIGEYDGH